FGRPNAGQVLGLLEDCTSIFNAMAFAMVHCHQRPCERPGRDSYGRSVKRRRNAHKMKWSRRESTQLLVDGVLPSSTNFLFGLEAVVECRAGLIAALKVQP